MDLVSAVPFDDRGLTLGIGLFETILVVDGQPLLWDAHVNRLRRGCAALGLPQPDETLVWVESQAVLKRSGLDRGRASLRLTWTGGSGTRGLAPPEPARPRLLIAVAKAPEPLTRVSLATSSIRRNSTSPTSRMKTLSYMDNVEARRLAASGGADEALLLNEFGDIASCAAANLMWLEADQLCTPPLSAGILDGVVRDLALAIARDEGWGVQEVEVPLLRLTRSEGAFITNSLIGAVEVERLDGEPISPLAGRARLLLEAIRAKASLN